MTKRVTVVTASVTVSGGEFHLWVACPCGSETRIDGPEEDEHKLAHLSCPLCCEPWFAAIGRRVK